MNFSRLSGTLIKLILIFLVSVAAVGILTGAALVLAKRTQIDVQRLLDDGLAGARMSGKLQLLMERHFRLVASAPSELDRKRVNALRLAVKEVEAELAAFNQADDILPGLLSVLHATADRVLLLADNFVQDQSIAEMQGPHTAAAEKITTILRTLRAKQHSIVSRQSEKITTTAQLLVGWVVVCAFILVLVGLVGFAVAWHTLARLTIITQIMLRLANGAEEGPIPFIKDSDEIGFMARAVDVFRLNAVRGREMECDREATTARDTARSQKIGMQIQVFQAAAQGLLETFDASSTRLRATAVAMQTTAENTSAQVQAASAGSEEATASVRIVAGAAGEMAATIADIDRRVSQAAEMARSTREDFAAATHRITHLQAASQQIKVAVQLISGLAAKTNLLAINAAIEAACAGASGRGFTVVAQEVKQLAAQTTQATREIAVHVENIQSATSDTARAVDDIRRSVSDMDVAAAAVAVSTAQQAIVVLEIGQNGQRAAQRTADVLENITWVRTNADTTKDVAGQVQVDASELGHRANLLRHEVARFISAVEAA